MTTRTVGKNERPRSKPDARAPTTTASATSRPEPKAITLSGLACRGPVDGGDAPPPSCVRFMTRSSAHLGVADARGWRRPRRRRARHRRAAEEGLGLGVGEEGGVAGEVAAEVLGAGLGLTALQDHGVGGEEGLDGGPVARGEGGVEAVGCGGGVELGLADGGRRGALVAVGSARVAALHGDTGGVSMPEWSIPCIWP